MIPNLIQISLTGQRMKGILKIKKMMIKENRVLKSRRKRTNLKFGFKRTIMKYGKDVSDATRLQKTVRCMPRFYKTRIDENIY